MTSQLDNVQTKPQLSLNLSWHPKLFWFCPFRWDVKVLGFPVLSLSQQTKLYKHSCSTTPARVKRKMKWLMWVTLFLLLVLLASFASRFCWLKSSGTPPSDEPPSSSTLLQPPNSNLNYTRAIPSRKPRYGTRREPMGARTYIAIFGKPAAGNWGSTLYGTVWWSSPNLWRSYCGKVRGG